MIIRATIQIKDDGTTRSRDFASEAEANQWFEQMAETQTYGPAMGWFSRTEDVTEAENALSDEREGAAARALGSRVIDRLRGVNLRKGFGLEDLMRVAADPQIQLAKLLLDTGAPQYARQVIEAVGPKYYTADEVAQILAPLDPPAPPVEESPVEEEPPVEPSPVDETPAPVDETATREA